MIKYLRLPFGFDVKKMQEDLRQIDTEAWKLHYQKLHYEGDWSAIPLRSVDGKADSIIVSPLPDSEYKDTIFLNECPYLKEVLAAFKCPLQAVRLLKLNAGGIIKEHRDIELNYEKGEIRIHVPVITHADVEFYLEGEQMHLKEGECWYMNFNLPHRINNKSSVNRVHLVIDAKVNDWVKELFSRKDISVKKEGKDPVTNYTDETKRQMILRFREMNTETANRMADELEKSGVVRDTGE